MTVADALNDAPVTELDLSRHVIAAPDDSVADTIERMSAAGYTCALVADGGKLAGIFTQRDVLTRVIGGGHDAFIHRAIPEWIEPVRLNPFG